MSRPGLPAWARYVTPYRPRPATEPTKRIAAVDLYRALRAAHARVCAVATHTLDPQIESVFDDAAAAVWRAAALVWPDLTVEEQQELSKGPAPGA